MLIVFKNNKKIYSLIITLLSFEILLYIIFSFLDIGGFTLTPYIRLFLIVFTSLFFTIDILKIKFSVKNKISKLHFSNIFVYGWLLYGVISVLIGVLNKNSILYIITDFIYIAFGSLLFYISDQNNRGKVTSSHFFFRFSRILASLAITCFFLNFKPPALLLILMVVLIYIHILKARLLDALFLLIPYFLLVFSTNRAQLVVFFLMVFIFLMKKFRIYFTKRLVLFLALSIIIVLFFLKQELINLVLFFVDENSNIGFRVRQIAVILTEGIDYSNPFFTSISQRIIEVEVVIDYWTENVISFLFGLGSGATIDGSKFYTDGSVLNSALLGSRNIHNIHILPFALIFRYGLIGLLLFCLLLLTVYKSFIKVLNEDKDIEKVFWNLFFIFWFFFSIPASSFLWSMPIFWISLSMIKKNYN